MKILNTLFGVAFALAFASVGFFIAQETAIPTYRSWQSMQTWQPATATLLNVSGSDNSTEANYRYRVDGIDYHGNRVDVTSFNDNIGSYHQDLYRKLQRLKNNNQSVAIWYNPDNPGQSVIDRDMRWGLFALMSGFCSVFILIGFGVGYASLRGNKIQTTRYLKPSSSELRKQWQQKQAESGSSESIFDFIRQRAAEHKQLTEYGQQPASPVSKGALPWLSKQEWRNNRFRSGAKTGLYFIWGFAIVWSAISSPILFVLEDELKQENYAALLGLLFPLVGLGLFFMAWKMTREWLHFGVIELELDPFPGSIGGQVGGSLFITQNADSSTPYKVELECVNTYVSGSGDNRSRRESIKWSEQGFAKAETTGRGMRLEFRFDVPEDLPEADIDQTGDYYFWRIRLTGESDVIHLKRDYNIPVFKTRTLSKHIRHDNSAQAAELRKEKAIASYAAINRGDFAKTALARAFRYKNTGQKQVFYYPMFRNKLLTLFALIFAGGFDFAAYAINQGFGGDGIMGIGMLIFSLPFALVGSIATIALIYLPLNNLTVTVADRKIIALRRLFFIPVLYHVIHARDIRSIETKPAGSTGQGVERIKHYKLVVHGRTGQKFTIAEDIDGEGLAEQLQEFIAGRLGIAA